MLEAERGLMRAASPETIVAATGRRLEEFAGLQRINLAPLAQSVGIEVASLSRPDLRVSLQAFMRLLHLLEIVSGDDCVGLHFADYFRSGDSGAFGFALLHAPTLREALRVYRTYQPTVADHGYFELAEEPNELLVRWRYPRLVDYSAQYTDFHAGLLVKMLRHFLGPEWKPNRVTLLRPQPRNMLLHRAHFGPEIDFQTAGSNVIAVPAAALDTPSGSDDPRLFEMMEGFCRTALAAVERGRDLRLQVAEQVHGLLPAGEASLARVARTLGIGERSLQRRLGQLGTSFERLVEQTRRELSDRLLAGDTPLSEISYLCGYSNASAYSRAARGWYGMSPHAMRKRFTREPHA